MKVQANGILMNYELSGSGPTLVLIHGFTDNLKMWYHQVPEFSRGYRVLTYDVRGFGRTEPSPGPYSMALFAEDLYQLLSALNLLPAHVLGYSMGGRIALEFCLRHPESTLSLIMANSVVGAPMTKEREERTRMLMELIQTRDNNRIAEIMTTYSFSPDFKEKDPQTFERYKAVKLENDPAGYLPVMAAMGAAAQAAVDLESIKCPVLVLAGTVDQFMPLAVAEAMVRRFPRAVLRTFPTGHITAIEDPAAFNRAVLEFLSEC